jgi:hypothetical protein
MDSWHRCHGVGREFVLEGGQAVADIGIHAVSVPTGFEQERLTA